MKNVFLIFLTAAVLYSPRVALSTETLPPQIMEEPVTGQEKVFNAEIFKLDNGMQVVVIPNHRTPVVTHMVWYKIGSADEVIGKSGIAHFLEHLMFKGSTYTNEKGKLVTLEPGAFSNIVKGFGGQDNAFTSQDYTAYFQSVPIEHLEEVMRMEAGRMRGMTLPESEVSSENKVILEERRQRTDNDPNAKFFEQIQSVLFVNHPYAIPIIGWEHEMAKLTREDAKAMYDLYYHPNNAILVVAGDVTGKQVFKLAKDIYGPIATTEVPPRTRPQSPPLYDEVEIVAYNTVIREPSVQITVKAPSYHTNSKDSYALDVLQDIMGGGPTSRLYKSLVVDQKIATGASMSYGGNSWDETQIWLQATPAPKTSPQEIEAALKEEMRKVVKDGVTEEELKDAITRLQDEAAYALDSLSGPAMIFGQAMASGTDVDDIEYWPTYVAGVTAEDVQRVAAKYLDPEGHDRIRFVTGYLLPKPAPAEVSE